jgi:hypothetical protein
MPAQKRHIQPAELTRRKGGKLGIQIGRRGEDRAGYVAAFDAIAAYHESHKLTSRRENLLTRIFGDGRRSANSATEGHWCPEKLKEKSQGTRRCGIPIMIRLRQFNQRLAILESWFNRVIWDSENRLKMRPKIADLTR